MASTAAMNPEPDPEEFRQFQAELVRLCLDFMAGEPLPPVIDLAVIPGGGKQAAALILAHFLIPKFADGICWIVPRTSLMDQAEQTFIDPFFQRLLGHTKEIRQSTNDHDPRRKMDGFVTTYQAVGIGWDGLIQEFDRARYILFLDEHHHVEENGTWHKALQHLKDRAVLVMLGSGNYERGDGHAIAFTRYYEGPDGKQHPLLKTDNERVAIRYGRATALRERAIKPLQFHYQDVQAQWLDQDGITRAIASFREADKQDATAALWTVLKTSAAAGILTKGLNDWLDYRRSHPWSKLLLVVHDIKQAKAVLAGLPDHLRDRAGIATSDDSAAARATIQRFKKARTDSDRLDVLVTVQMAYEGLDVPAITHLVCLTHIRSRPWIEQMLARAARVYRKVPYEGQWGYIYGPDDPMLIAICEAIRAEQEAVLRGPGDVRPRPPIDPPPTARDEIVPLDAGLTHERVEDFASGESSEPGDDEELLNLAREHGLGWVPFKDLRALINDLRRSGTGKPEREPAPADDPIPPIPHSVRESQLRKAIEDYVRRWEWRKQVDHGTLNRAIWDVFRKRRQDMTLDELQSVWAYIVERYADTEDL